MDNIFSMLFENMLRSNRALAENDSFENYAWTILIKVTVDVGKTSQRASGNCYPVAIGHIYKEHKELISIRFLDYWNAPMIKDENFINA